LENYRIEQLLPHRYPFLLIDRIVEIESGKRGVALKNLTADDFFFNFSDNLPPTILQAMMIEGLAQTAAIVSSYGKESSKRNPGRSEGFMVGIDNFIFISNPKPSDQLYFHVELLRKYGTLFKFSTWVVAERIEIARGELTFAIS
jgi:3-hydroxyacyl-[acyl-carrier-protein] dehydratase